MANKWPDDIARRAIRDRQARVHPPRPMITTLPITAPDLAQDIATARHRAVHISRENGLPPTRSCASRADAVAQSANGLPAWAVAPDSTLMPRVLTDLAPWLRFALAVPSFLRKGFVRCTFNVARSRLVRKVIFAGGVATILPIIECGTPIPTKSRDI